MQWVAPSEKDAANDTLEKRLWQAADQLRANSGLTSAQYSQPVLGMIFLRFADAKFSIRRAVLEKKASSSRVGPRTEDPTAYHAEGVLFIPAGARFDELLNFPEGGKTVKKAGKDEHLTLGQAVNDAMRAIEAANPQLAGVLPKSYQIFNARLLKELLKAISTIPATIEGDAFGKIYEYFLGEFAMTEGQMGGEFYTPISIVRLIVEILEPFHGQILDPACGSGGMFVQSARFVAEHQKNAATELSICGVEKVDDTGRLCRLNLAVHGLEGDIKHGGDINSYYDDPHQLTGKFDYVLANPPFNVNAVDKDRLKDQTGPARRFPFGLPRTDNANYLWIQLFYAALNTKGRAGFVMANSASDARASEQEIRRQLIQSRAVDAIVAVGPNMFYTVTLPCTLWFFDRAKAKTPRADTVLFIDARHIYRQIDRAHRDWTPAQIGFLANIVRLYRGEQPDFTLGGHEAATKLAEIFPTIGKTASTNFQSLENTRNAGTPARDQNAAPANLKSVISNLKYADIPGLCRAATLAEIETQGWSLNPGRYVGVAPGEHVSDEDFKEQLEELNEELETLNAAARKLETTIAANVAEILET